MGRYGTPIFRFVNIHGLGCQIQGWGVWIWHDSCAFCQQRFKCNPVAGHGRRDDMCARFKASGSLWNDVPKNGPRRKKTGNKDALLHRRRKDKRETPRTAVRSHEDTTPEPPCVPSPRRIQGRGVHPMRTRVTCRGRDGTRVDCDQDHLFKTGPLSGFWWDIPELNGDFNGKIII